MCCGSIPIYSGPPDVDKYLPLYTFIDCRGLEPEEICERINDMDEDEYEEYLSNIYKFITAESTIDFYSSVRFAEKIVTIIENEL